MLLTMADTSCGGLLAGHAGMSLYGPPGLNTLVNAFRTFVNVRDIGLKVTEFGGSSGSGCAAGEAAAGGAAAQLRPVVKSELVSITPVVLTAAAPASAEAGAEPEAKRQRVEAASNGDASSAGAEAAAAGAGASMDIASVAVEGPAACYICELPDVPGKFLPQKVGGRLSGWLRGCARRLSLLPAATTGGWAAAGTQLQLLLRASPSCHLVQAAALGVPRGPLCGKLVRGEEVTAANGQVVRPQDVMEPTTPGGWGAGGAGQGQRHTASCRLWWGWGAAM
jgi:ribonuclease Z